tara:strand:+ start:5725 stop:6096 length:372 start_codon:yes stop_codon:yes gene_type:complete
MLKSVSANGDSCSGDTPGGHPHPPTTSITQYHGLLYIDGKQASHIGEDWPQHACTLPLTLSHPTHFHINRKTSSGSDLVFIEGDALGRVGDTITGPSTWPPPPPPGPPCEAVIVQGSEFVFSE